MFDRSQIFPRARNHPWLRITALGDLDPQSRVRDIAKGDLFVHFKICTLGLSAFPRV